MKKQNLDGIPQLKNLERLLYTGKEQTTYPAILDLFYNLLWWVLHKLLEGRLSLSRLLSPELRTGSGRAGPHDTITASALPLTDSILCTAHTTLRGTPGNSIVKYNLCSFSWVQLSLLSETTGGFLGQTCIIFSYLHHLSGLCHY